MVMLYIEVIITDTIKAHINVKQGKLACMAQKRLWFPNGYHPKNTAHLTEWGLDERVFFQKKGLWPSITIFA